MVELAKSAFDICYNTPVGVADTTRNGLFENVEMTMTHFKRGDAVWIFWQDQFGYPQMHHRPGIIQKKVHPADYLVAFAANDYRKPKEQWALDRRAHHRHPTDLLSHDADPGKHLRAMREKWCHAATPETIAAQAQEVAERKRMNEDIKRTLRPILARMYR